MNWTNLVSLVHETFVLMNNIPRTLVLVVVSLQASGVGWCGETWSDSDGVFQGIVIHE